MDFDFIAGIGWRGAVLAVAAVSGIYLALSLIRLLRVGDKRRDAAQQEVEPMPAGGDSWSPPKLAEGRQLPPAASAAVPDFAQELARSSVELEMERLRRESAHLREEVARLSEEVSQLRATRNVSPLYNEAMALAQQGMAANGIAGRCGISIGEAELVAAMARSASEFDRHELGEEDYERNGQSGNPGNRPRS